MNNTNLAKKVKINRQDVQEVSECEDIFGFDIPVKGPEEEDLLRALLVWREVRINANTISLIVTERTVKNWEVKTVLDNFPYHVRQFEDQLTLGFLGDALRLISLQEARGVRNQDLITCIQS